MKAPRQSRPIPTLAEALRYCLRLVHLIRPYWGEILKGLALSLVIGLFGMVIPYTSKLLIDNAYPAGDLSFARVVVIGVVVLTVSSSIMSAVQSYFSQTVSGRIGNATSVMFFNHLQHLEAAFFDEHQVGEVMSRFQDLRNALSFVSDAFQTIFASGMYVVLVPPILLVLNWELALLSIVVVPATVATSAASSRVIRKYYKKNAEANADLNAYQYEVFSHIRTLKAMAIEPWIYSQVSRQRAQVLHTQLMANGVGALMGLANGILRAAGNGLFLWYAWTLILHHELTLGAFIAFTAYVGYFTGPLNKFASLFNGFQQSAVSLGRMFEYLDTTPEQEPTLAYTAAVPPPRHKAAGEIEFRNVSFGYAAGPEILHDISMTAARGRITAIIGPSGAGKSSLLRMIPRLHEPRSGEILLDGTPTRQIALPVLRQQIAIVWQESSLMRGTVRDNLVLGAATPPARLIDKAIHVCQLDGLIAQLPDGIDSPVAEWGNTLSGGQRQRVAIARALIRDTPILLLDEATANIDVQTEADLLHALFVQFRDKTIIFVTHRVATARCADHVCVIADGRMSAAGNPEGAPETSELSRHLRDLSIRGTGSDRVLVMPSRS